MNPQGGEGIRGPSTAPAGGTIDIEVGSNDQSIWVNSGTNLSEYKVPPSKKVTIPVPPAPGELFVVTVGTGLNKRSLIITIVSPSP